MAISSLVGGQAPTPDLSGTVRSSAMSTVRAEELIGGSPKAVFDLFTDQTQWHAWLPGHSGCPEGIPDSVAKGSSFPVRFGFFGITDNVTITVEESHRPARLVLRADTTLGASARMAFDLEPAESGATLARADAEMIGKAPRMIANLAQKVLNKNFAKGLEQLATHLEAAPH